MKKVLFVFLAVVAVVSLVSSCGSDEKRCGYGDYCWQCPTERTFEACCDPFPMSPDLCGACVRIDKSLCWE